MAVWGALKGGWKCGCMGGNVVVWGGLKGR